ncbi:D-alanine--D-alanine ligase family protein [Dethiosulfovibrio salsuginis]|uniref:D-alanine--D-alanine ligase n=1 Tax=Dethiosulfovibrio salsuginis TaxID=561720 RepID=A0A1X7IQI7_9BACT|nr:D-alanine--D-alanine ligase [Dethiosulfovibrio salsuginis]SMG17288.1 D-alanine-D-alanine ligase [Dethiosulfovibrio salsuginis]
MAKRNITVLCGGNSPERAVSLESGRAVAQGLTEAGHSVQEVDLVSSEGVFDLLREKRPDLFFIALHGGWGEDGHIQAVLDMAGVPYTGSGPVGCAVAMDKVVSKAVFSSSGIDVPWGLEVHKGEFPDLSEDLLRWGGLVVKPCCGGSTVGTSIVSHLEDLSPALWGAWEQEDRALVEAYVPGRELTVAVIDFRGVPRALPAVEIAPEGGFYDYRAKYGGGSCYTSPADLAPSLAELLASQACAAHRASGCSIYSRVDFRVDPDGRPWVLEVNTAPGMTSNSLVPKAAKAAGYSFPELLDYIVEESLILRG